MKTAGVLFLGATALAILASLVRTRGFLESSPDPSDARSRETPMRPGPIRALGYVEPVSEVRRLVFRREGVVARCSINCGDRVGEGDLLMALANDEEAARLTVAQRELELAQAERRQVGAGVNEHRIIAAQRKVEDSAHFERHANQHLARISALSGKGAVTDAEQDLAEYDAAHGKAALGQAKAELDELRHFVRPVDLAAAEARVALAEARVAEAQAELEATFLRAPFEGIVLEILRREGESARASDGSAVVVFGDTSRLRVRAEVDDRCVHELREGQSAVISGRGLGTETFAGRVGVVKRLMGSKTVFARTSSERKDVGIIEILVHAPPSFSAPVGLQVDVAIERRSGKPVVEGSKGRAGKTHEVSKDTDATTDEETRANVH